MADFGRFSWLVGRHTLILKQWETEVCDEAFGVMLLAVDGVLRYCSFKLWVYFGMITSHSIWLVGQGLLAVRFGRLGFYLPGVEVWACPCSPEVELC